LYILVEGDFVHRTPLHLFRVDLIVITIAYLIASTRDTGACFLAFGAGLMTDIFSAGPFGLYTFLYVNLHMGIKIGSLLLDLMSEFGQIILVALAVFFKEILFLSILYLFSLKFTLGSGDILSAVASAISTGLVTPIIFFCFQQVSRSSIKGSKETPEAVL
jgi:rod shape-determining protein MreD